MSDKGRAAAQARAKKAAQKRVNHAASRGGGRVPTARQTQQQPVDDATALAAALDLGAEMATIRARQERMEQKLDRVTRLLEQQLGPNAGAQGEAGSDDS